MIKTLSKLGIDGNFLNLIKNIYENSTGNNIPNGERLKAFLLRPGTRQEYLLLPFLFNMVLEAPARAIR